MAMFPSRDRDAFFSHWARTRARADARTMTITYGDAVAGNIGSWEDGEQVFLGYWIGKSYWGRGIATAALSAYVTEHEPRLCGFELVSRTTEFDPAFGVDVEELLMEYRPGGGDAS